MNRRQPISRIQLEISVDNMSGLNLTTLPPKRHPYIQIRRENAFYIKYACQKGFNAFARISSLVRLHRLARIDTSRCL